jgi:hypothetical protein
LAKKEEEKKKNVKMVWISNLKIVSSCYKFGLLYVEGRNGKTNGRKEKGERRKENERKENERKEMKKGKRKKGKMKVWVKT